MNRWGAKVLQAGLLAGLVAASGPGQDLELDAVLDRMGVSVELPKGASVVPIPEQSDVVCQLAYRLPGRSYEVRCSFFPVEYIADQAQGCALEDYVPMFTVLVLMCIAQEEIYFGRMVELPEESVKREFGADHGVTALVRGDCSEFSRGRKYVVVNSFYKKDRGVVNVYFLYDDPDDLDMDSFEYARAYYCFRFRD